MGWEELIDALDELETEVEYDGVNQVRQRSYRTWSIIMQGL